MEEIHLTNHEAYIFELLANGWVAEHTMKREFRINNGPPEDFAIIERLMEGGYAMQSSKRAYVAAFSPWPYVAGQTKRGN